jgi:prepilin signal peptidase PulO-like enzyme (type II secretory pathway)
MAAGSAALISVGCFIVLLRLGCSSIRPWLAPRARADILQQQWSWALISGLLAAGLVHLTVPAEAALERSALISLGYPLMLALWAALLSALSLIDLKSRLLPDPLTFGMVLMGLLSSLVLNMTPLTASVLGAVMGYGCLWAFARCYESWRQKMAMGRGDFAMLSGIGAWVGVEALALVLLIASSLSLLVLIPKRLMNMNAAAPSALGPSLMQHQVAFGPALATGAACSWFLR